MAVDAKVNIDDVFTDNMLIRAIFEANSSKAAAGFRNVDLDAARRWRLTGAVGFQQMATRICDNRFLSSLLTVQPMQTLKIRSELLLKDPNVK
jgi:hypothetical protein